MTAPVPPRQKSGAAEQPIRSAKDFIRRYFPSAKECPHCHGTGMQRDAPFKYRDSSPRISDNRL